MAWKLLAMPISIVASEFAFSTGGRVLDPYHSSLSHQKVEVIICTHDWLKDTPLQSLLDYDFEELECVDQDMLMFQLCNNITVKYVLSNDNFFICYRVSFSTKCWPQHDFFELKLNPHVEGNVFYTFNRWFK